MPNNQLYYGDNLEVLTSKDDHDRYLFPAESVDLIYLDPPFNSRRDYNVLYKTPKGKAADAQATAFRDTWVWSAQAQREYRELVPVPEAGQPARLIPYMSDRVTTTTEALHRLLGDSDMMAYLTMMARRLVELHRVLKPTGTLFLHCDPTASHYLKIVLDAVFGGDNFKNEIIWQRINAKGNVQRKFGAVHDVILVYAKQLGRETWNQLYRPLDPEYVRKMYRYVEEGTGRRYRLDNLTAPITRASKGQIYEWKGKRPKPTRCWVYAIEKMEELDREGRIVYSKTGYPAYKRYLDEMEGEKLPDTWTDIAPASGKESLGYPTQKPLALLERIILSSTNPDDIILDPFCGCGTAIHAAHRLNRQWVGIDITYLAIDLIERRMQSAFPGLMFETLGKPKDIEGAQALADRDKYQFQWWICSLLNVQAYQGKKKGADFGVDGIGYFADIESGRLVERKVIVSVKGGKNVNPEMVRALATVRKQQDAEIALFVMMKDEPTPEMERTVIREGYYQAGNGQLYPRIQILSVEGLMTNRQRPQYPDLSRGSSTFREAPKDTPDSGQQKLF